jgi:ABC-type transport system substrate-binding protein
VSVARVGAAGRPLRRSTQRAARGGRFRVRYALPLLAGLAVVACGDARFPTPLRSAPVVRVSSPARVSLIGPERGWSYYDSQVIGYLFEGLTRVADDGNLVPALARSWSHSPDGRVYRFRLRSGVRFHDGTPFDASEVVRAWTALLRLPPDSLTHPWMLDGVEGARAFSRGETPTVTGLQVVDDTTLVVRLAEPLAFFPTLLSHTQTAIAAVTSTGEHPIGTGPWRFVSRDSDEIRLVKNADYWDDPPLLDSLVHRYVPDSLTERAFNAGWVDLASELPAATLLEWRTRSDIGFVESEAQTATRLVINMREPVFADVRVRQALNHAVNATLLAKATAAPSVVRAAGAIPPSLPGADPSREPYTFDPGLARTLLRSGGYPEDRPLRLRVPGPGLSDFPAESGTLLRDYFEAVGLHVQLTVASEGIETALADQTADLVLTVWVGDYPDGDAFLYPLYHSDLAGSAGNEGAYRNPAADRLMDASRHELDPTRRARLLRAADSLIFADAPVVFLWFTRTAAVYSLRLEGWGRDPFLSRLTSLTLASDAK